jgi:hypothetical protein
VPWTHNRKILPVACPWSVVLSGYSASSTTKTGRHDIAEILLKLALKHQKSNQITQQHINNFNKTPIFQFSLNT